ncbi:hypothetical protein FE257_010549 [Aspergillus nanangensis]|uniref:Nudix hydrolase domain-containing protein n=1 Tax=Aspergillus nanangensis TaxID=2582783 RepID=A0AAD4CID7_ASPNN|nr:hypothetical protein FE257_010549 [Aspergillus nanangensis]
MTPNTILDIVKECDNFIYYADNPTEYITTLQTHYYAFKVSNCASILGYIPASLIPQIPWNPETWHIDHESHTVTLTAPPPATNRSRLLEQTLREVGPQISLLRGWRNETFPVYGPSQGEVLLEIERCASALFGIVTYGVQLLCYERGRPAATIITRECPSDEAASASGGGNSHPIKLWIARRSSSKQTYPGMLDCTAAGGLPTGKSPLEGVIAEALEEASLPESLVRTRLRATGCVSYFHVRGPKAGGETGLLQPEVEYTYEMELGGAVRPSPSDEEVEEFRLWEVEEVLDALRRGEFKPNSAVVVVDFLIRHGLLTAENERDYVHILPRLHRRLEFPLCIYR